MNHKQEVLHSSRQNCLNKEYSDLVQVGGTALPSVKWYPLTV